MADRKTELEKTLAEEVAAMLGSETAEEQERARKTAREATAEIFSADEEPTLSPIEENE